MKKLSAYLVLFIACVTSYTLQAQPSNDNCTNATPISVGNVPPCGSGLQSSATTTVTGNITTATPGNPYVYQTNCSGSSTSMSTGANDVWYTFVATGYQAVITVNSSFANPNVALYSGNCAALGGGVGGCSVGSGGVTTLTVNQLAPGTTYYLQVSGNAGQTGTFTMTIKNTKDCTDCLVSSNITVSPLPTNGMYAPGTTVQICFHINQYNTINTNWLHGVQLSFGSGWLASSLTTNNPSAVSTSGSWSYYPGGIGVQNGQTWGPGWYFDYNPTDGNPKNNFGDYASGTVANNKWNFCATLKTNTVCTPGSNLSVTFNTSGDGESGSWSNSGCTGDSPAIFNAMGSCCPPVMSMVPVTCFSTSTGTAVATPVGTMSPYTYNWSGPGGYSSSTTGVTGASTITNVPAGIYTVQVIDKNSCAITNTIQVTQPTSITLTPSSTPANCTTGGSASVTASGGTPGYTYTWSPTGGNSSIASNLLAGTYTVSVQDSKLCSRTATVTVAQTGSVSAAFSTPTPTQCLTGNSYVFTPSVTTGSHTYSFNPSTGAPAPGSSSTYGPVSFTAPGTYTVIHTITSGICTNTATSVIVIKPQPTVMATNNGPVCVGSNLVLTGGGGGTYSWSGPGFSSAVQNPTITNVTLANGGVYTLTVTLNGCTEVNTTTVVVTTATASASNTGPYCPGTTIQLNTPAATSYTWSGPAAFSSNLQNPTIGSASVAMSGNYTVNIMLGSCTASAVTNVTVHPAPTPTAGNNGPICDGQTLNLTSGGGASYAWSGPGSFTSGSQNTSIAVASPSNSGTYSVLVTNANTCTSVATTTVLVNPLPVVTATNNGPVCVGSSLILTGGGGGTYAWSGPGFTSAVQNPTITNVTLANAGVYTLTVTLNGCTSINSTTVVVTTATASANNTGPYCAGTTIQLNTPAATSYTWSGPGSFSSNLQNPTIGSASVAMSGNYTVNILLGTCTASAVTNVTVHPLPTPTIGSNSPVCDGQTLNLTSGGGSSYAWTGPSFTSSLQNPSIAVASPSNSGTYSVIVTDANSCTSVASTSVTVNPLPSITVNSPTVCLNQTINLTATGGTAFAWTGPAGFTSSSQNPSIPNASLSANGQYTVMVTSVDGCTNTAVATVSVFPLPTPTITSNTPCVGATLNLTGGGGATYVWTGPNSFTSTTQNPSISNVSMAANGVYTLIASAGSCSASTTVSVTINALPNPTIGSNSPVCDGQILNLTSGGGVTYVWTGPSGFTSTNQNPSVAVASASNTGTYTVLVTDANTCTNVASTSVTINPLPSITVNSPTVCMNQTINLTANGGTNYLWTGPNSFGSASQNPSIPNAQPNASGQYTVLVTSAAGCTNTAVSTVSVYPLPAPAIASNTPCVGGTLNLAGSGGATYAWTGPNSFSSTSQNPNISNVNSNANGLYTLIVSSGSCSGSVTANITINPLPVPVVNNNSPVCPGQPIILTGNGGVAYAWNGPSSFNSSAQSPTITNASPSNAGVYSVIVTDANNCSSVGTTTVVVNPVPNPTATGTTICQNANATLSATGGNSYSWAGPGGFVSFSQNPTIPNAQLNASGEYTVLVTSVAGCTNTATANLVVTAAPVPNVSSNSPICLNNSLNLTANGGVTYAWSGPNGFISSLQNPTLTASSAAYSGNYFVSVTDANNCTGMASIGVTVNPLPSAFITAGNNIGCPPFCTTFTVQSSPAAANTNWVLGNGAFSNGVNATSGCYNSTGTYTVGATVTDVNGCIGYATHTVQVYPQPVADFNYSPFKPIVNVDANVHFTDASHSGTITSWNWYFMNTPQYQSTQQNPSFTYQDPGTYVVALIVKTNNGCTDTILKPIVVGEDFGLYVPNAFTPNADGMNDIFQPKGFGIVKYTMQIFDRWGEKIFETSEFEQGWDGTYRGKLSQDDSYTWLINATDVFGKAHEYTGHVILIK
jgi:gliding motility-associated-like protein